MSNNEVKENDKNSQDSGRHSSHKEISDKQHAKELKDIQGQDDTEEPNKPKFSQEDNKKEVNLSINDTKIDIEQVSKETTKNEKTAEDSSPKKPNIPKDKKKAKEKQIPFSTYKTKNKPTLDKKMNQSKRTNASNRSGAASKAKNTNSKTKGPQPKTNEEEPTPATIKEDQVIVDINCRRIKTLSKFRRRLQM